MASRACGNDDGGNWIPCGQKPEQVTLHRDKIPESARQVSLCLFLSFPLHFSTPRLPLSSSASHSPLLSFPSTFLDIWSSWDTQVTVFTAWPTQRCIHSFLPCFLPHSLLSPSCPPHLLLDYSLGLILPWHTLSSQMKETLSDCLVFQRSRILHKGTLCMFCSSFGLNYSRWEILQMKMEQIRCILE